MADKQHIYIGDDLTNSFLCDAIPIIRSFRTVEEYCPVCRHYIRFPLIVRRNDIEAFETLLEIAEKYLVDKGGMRAMLIDIMQQIKSNIEVKDIVDNILKQYE